MNAEEELRDLLRLYDEMLDSLIAKRAAIADRIAEVPVAVPQSAPLTGPAGVADGGGCSPVEVNMGDWAT